MSPCLCARTLARKVAVHGVYLVGQRLPGLVRGEGTLETICDHGRKAQRTDMRRDGDVPAHRAHANERKHELR